MGRLKSGGGYYLVVVLRVIVIVSLCLPFAWDVPPTLAACTISGTVYRDYNADGVRAVLEPGVEGITVRIFNEAGVQVNTAVTAADGTYTVNVAAIPNGDEARVEFDTIPDALRSGRYGAQSTTTVTFVICTGVINDIDLGVNNPGGFCHLDTPDLATSCYTADDQLTGGGAGLRTFIGFPYGSAGDAPYNPLAIASEIGTTYGLAYQRSSDSFFAASYVKRHAGLGPDATGVNTTTGGIYRIIRTGPSAGASLFIDLQAMLPAAVNTGADPHPDAACDPGVLLNCWMYDPDTWFAVGKTGIGDLDISDDDRTLFAVNLRSRELIQIPIGIPTVVPTAGQLRRYPIVTNLTPAPGCPVADRRPFGLGVHDGMVYVGMVCSAESTQDRADLHAYVYRFDPLNPGPFREVLNFPLDYPRRCADLNLAAACLALREAEWQPWSDAWPTPSGPILIRPEPMLSDIVFDNGDMILGFRDRLGDRTGSQRPRYDAQAVPAPVPLYSGIAAGDMLRACPDPFTAGRWIIESNATCGAAVTGGAGNLQGPDDVVAPVGGGEFYFEDMNDPANDNRHDEILLGGLVQVPGRGDVAATAYDPLPPAGADQGLFDGGLIWFDNATGQRVQNYRVFNSNFVGAGGFFGKSNGLGDLEAVCGLAPLQIGNRVWEDLDRNGIQDPNELPLAGVIVSLYDGTGALLGQTTTNAAGEYYFDETNIFNAADPRTYWDSNGSNSWQDFEPGGVLATGDYEVRLDDPANYGGGVLTPYYLTRTNTSLDQRDNDATNPSPLDFVDVGNVPVIALTTGDWGENDHTFDFGFSLIPPPPNQPLGTPPPDEDGGLPPELSTVTELPRTGESPFSSARNLLLVMLSGLGLAGLGWAAMRKVRRSS